MKNTTLSIQILPLGTAQKKSLSIIDSVIALIKKSGLTSEVGPMETTIEGNLENLLELLNDIQNLMLKSAGTAVLSNIKIIVDKKGVLSIAEKVNKHR